MLSRNLLESTNTPCLQEKRISCKYMTSTKAVSSRRRIGDTARIEAQKFVVLLALSHSLEPTPKSLNESYTRATWASRVEDDRPAERRVI